MKNEVFWCGSCGILDEEDLIEGQDSRMASYLDPDGWNCLFYHRADDGQMHEAALVTVAPVGPFAEPA